MTIYKKLIYRNIKFKYKGGGACKKQKKHSLFADQTTNMLHQIFQKNRALRLILFFRYKNHELQIIYKLPLR